MADNTIHTPSNNTAIDGSIKAPLPTPMDRGEAPSAWASSTLDALAPAKTEPYSADEPRTGKTGLTGTSDASAYPSSMAEPSSTATTPGPQVPGAFPYMYTKQSVLPQGTQDVKDAAANALETAKGYVATAGETVGGYLPESMAAYLPYSQSQRTNKIDSELTNPNATVTQASDNKSNDLSPSYFPSTPAGNPVSSHTESETMRDGGKDGSTILPQSQRQGAEFAASTNTSTQSLAGSGVDTWSHTSTPGSSLMAANSDRTNIGNTGGQDQAFKATNSTTTAESRGAESEIRNMDVTGILKDSPSTPADAMEAAKLHKPEPYNAVVDEPERPDLEHHADETRHIPEVDAPPTAEPKWQAPETGSPKHFESPNTTAREHPIGTVDFAHQDSAYSDVATPGHGHMTASTNTSADNSKEMDLADAGGAVAAATAISDAHPNKVPAAPGTQATTANAIDSAPIGIGPTPTTSKNAHDSGSDKGLPTPPSSTASDSKDAAAAPATPPKKTKSGFMDKLRGEMKVLSGKLEHKQEKVEEGRKMMGKTPTKN